MFTTSLVAAVHKEKGTMNVCSILTGYAILSNHKNSFKWYNFKVKTVDIFLYLLYQLSVSVPNFTISYSYLANIACFRKVK